jgi:raffinose/stachyose/melibiose transport system permease protein
MEKKNIRSPQYYIFWSLAIAFAVLWLVVALGPFYYMILTSFKTRAEFLSGKLFSLPKKFSFFNFADVLHAGFWRYFANSILVVVVSLSLLLFFSACASYPLARMKFKFNMPIFAGIVAAMSIPIHITLIPVFSMSLKLGLYDKVWAVIGPNVAFNLPISIFILTSFMRGISKEMEEAAEIDGCDKFATFFKIIFPLSKSGLATLAIYNGVAIWNEFSFIMILTQSKEVRTLPLAVWEQQGERTTNIPAIMALLILSSLPIILLYVFGQDKLVKGMMVGAVKG